MCDTFVMDRETVSPNVTRVSRPGAVTRAHGGPGVRVRVRVIDPTRTVGTASAAAETTAARAAAGRGVSRDGGGSRRSRAWTPRRCRRSGRCSRPSSRCPAAVRRPGQRGPTRGARPRRPRRRRDRRRRRDHAGARRHRVRAADAAAAGRPGGRRRPELAADRGPRRVARPPARAGVGRRARPGAGGARACGCRQARGPPS